jgi:hypothetical protein
LTINARAYLTFKNIAKSFWKNAFFFSQPFLLEGLLGFVCLLVTGPERIVGRIIRPNNPKYRIIIRIRYSFGQISRYSGIRQNNSLLCGIIRNRNNSVSVFGIRPGHLVYSVESKFRSLVMFGQHSQPTLYTYWYILLRELIIYGF